MDKQRGKAVVHIPDICIVEAFRVLGKGAAHAIG